MKAWSNYFRPTGHFSKTWLLSGHFVQQHDVWNNRTATFETKMGK